MRGGKARVAVKNPMQYEKVRYVGAVKVSDFDYHIYSSRFLLQLKVETPATGHEGWLPVRIEMSPDQKHVRYVVGVLQNGSYLTRRVSARFKTLDGLLRALFKEFRDSDKLSLYGDGQTSMVSGFKAVYRGQTVSLYAEGELEDAE